MSVTFSCFEAPRETLPCEFCVEAVAEKWDTNGRCDRFCTGTMTETTAPEVNFANANAQAVLSLLGLGGDLWGGCEADELGGFRQRILRARNSDRSDAVVVPSELEPGHAGTAVVTEDGMTRIERRGPRMVCFGNTDEQTLRRLTALDRLAAWAQKRDFAISWG